YHDDFQTGDVCYLPGQTWSATVHPEHVLSPKTDITAVAKGVPRRPGISLIRGTVCSETAG
ncbi:hypothetical protein P7K49_012407, partial [Saguinus oedipus]